MPGFASRSAPVAEQVLVATLVALIGLLGLVCLVALRFFTLWYSLAPYPG